jgi:hypothetical protein
VIEWVCCVRDLVREERRVGRSLTASLAGDEPPGDITATFRLWRRPRANVGGHYRVGRAEIEIDSMEHVPFAGVPEIDVRRAGELDRESLRARAAHAGPIGDDTLLYRIAFHVVG